MSSNTTSRVSTLDTVTDTTDTDTTVTDDDVVTMLVDDVSEVVITCMHSITGYS